MKKAILIYFTSGLIVLAGCNGNSELQNISISFEEIIDLRLNDDSSIRGKEILINSNLRSNFRVVCPAVLSVPCVDPALIDDEDLTTYEITNEYGHAKKGIDSCQTGFIDLVSEDGETFEYLAIDYSEHTEFFMITSDKTVNTNFLATVEFTDEIDYCAKKIYKGTTITLSEGEHAMILDLYID